MKKIVLGLLLLCCLNAQAQRTQTYTDDLIVNINGQAAPAQQTAIDVAVKGNNIIDLTLKNFILQSPNPETGEVDLMPVGNIAVTDVELTPATGCSTFNLKRTITIAEGDAALSPFWMGPQLGPIEIAVMGEINDERIYLTIDIDLSQTLQQVVHVTVGTPIQVVSAGYFQLANSNFEEWDNLGEKSEEPAHWNSFMNASGLLASVVAAQQVARSSETRPGSAGEYSARIYARNVIFGIIAQGNLTTGRINGGAMSATDATGNYNYTQIDDSNFHQQLTGLPDSLRIWVKSNCKYNGSISCVLHTEGYYQDPEANDITARVVATAKDNTVNTGNDWQLVSIPFDYALTDGTRPAYALMTLTTSGEPGKGDAKDEMLVDDVEMVYNSELATAVYDGQTVTFDENGAASLKATKAFDPALLQLTANGRGATIETDYTDADCGEFSGLLLITVRGDDNAVNRENQHLYSISFCSDNDRVNELAAQQRSNNATFDLTGRRVQQPQRPGIYVRGGKKVVKQ